MIDMGKIRREAMRWNMIRTLDWHRPVTMPESRLLEVIQTLYPDSTQMEVRRELDYLEGRNLVVLDKQPSGTWFADLTCEGIDLAEYTVECEPGIARPVKYGIS